MWPASPSIPARIWALWVMRAALITNDQKLADRMTMFARHGGLKKGEHQIEGINSRLDGLQAAILLVKLNHIQKWTKDRQRIASYYAERLGNIQAVRLPEVLPAREHVWHLYVIRHENRGRLGQTPGE